MAAIKVMVAIAFTLSLLAQTLTQTGVISNLVLAVVLLQRRPMWIVIQVYKQLRAPAVNFLKLELYE